MTALQKMIDTIASGTPCIQEAGYGPFVLPDAKGSKPFASRTARQGERLGLMVLSYEATHGKGKHRWCWVLTEKGRRAASNTELSRATK